MPENQWLETQSAVVEQASLAVSRCVQTPHAKEEPLHRPLLH